MVCFSACRLNLSSVVMCRLLHVLGFPPQVSSLSSVTYVACICTAQAQVLGGVLFSSLDAA